jgi:hypothetical protein
MRAGTNWQNAVAKRHRRLRFCRVEHFGCGFLEQIYENAGGGAITFGVYDVMQTRFEADGRVSVRRRDGRRTATHGWRRESSQAQAA